MMIRERPSRGRSARPLWNPWRQGRGWRGFGALAVFSLALMMALALGLPDRTLFYLSLPLAAVLFAAYRASRERLVESRRHAEDRDQTSRELHASFQRVGEALAAPLDAAALHRLIVDLCHDMLAPQMSGLCLWRDGALQLTEARFAPTFPSGCYGPIAGAVQKAAAIAGERGQPMSTPTDGLLPGSAGGLAFAVPLGSPERMSGRTGGSPTTPGERSGVGEAGSAKPGGQCRLGAICVLFDPWTGLTGVRRQLLTGFATQAALALQNARLFEAEHDVADTMRQSLLPPARLEVPDLEIGTFHESLAIDAGGVGGDYYDAFALSDGQVVVSIADVCGKGIAAAVRAARSKYTVRAYAVEAPSPHQVLARVNAAFVAQESDPESFTTLAYVLLDPRSGRLVLSAAGHPPPLLYRSATGRCCRLDAGGAALGVLPGERYDEVLEALGPGDTLLLYTDGVVEARGDREEFGLDRLEAEFERRAGQGTQEIAEALVEAARRFAHGRLADDVTVLVLRNTFTLRTSRA